MKKKGGDRVKKFSGTKGIICLAIMAMLVVGYYYHLSNRSVAAPEEMEVDSLSAVQEVLVRNMETNYPQTPREVVKYFAELTKCLYNEELSDEDVYELGMRFREIYDDELIANQEEDDYLEQLKADVVSSHSKGQTLFNYTLSSSVDVETFSQNGYDIARLHCIFGIRQDLLLYNSDTIFVLRKDENGHYKILGWTLAAEAQEK